jgi:hypothetical protein
MERSAETRQGNEPLVESAPDEAVISALAQINGYPTKGPQRDEPLVEPADDEAVIRALAQISSYPTKSE